MTVLQLQIINHPPEQFTNQQHGSNHSFTIKVEATVKPTTAELPERVPLSIYAAYEGSPEHRANASDKAKRELLQLFGTTDLYKGCAELSLRLNEVSRNHKKNRFVIVINVEETWLQRKGWVCTRVVSNPVKVISKIRKTKATLKREREQADAAADISSSTTKGSWKRPRQGEAGIVRYAKVENSSSQLEAIQPPQDGAEWVRLACSIIGRLLRSRKVCICGHPSPDHGKNCPVAMVLMTRPLPEEFVPPRHTANAAPPATDAPTSATAGDKWHQIHRGSNPFLQAGRDAVNGGSGMSGEGSAAMPPPPPPPRPIHRRRRRSRRRPATVVKDEAAQRRQRQSQRHPRPSTVPQQQGHSRQAQPQQQLRVRTVSNTFIGSDSRRGSGSDYSDCGSSSGSGGRLRRTEALLRCDEDLFGGDDDGDDDKLTSSSTSVSGTGCDSEEEAHSVKAFLHGVAAGVAAKSAPPKQALEAAAAVALAFQALRSGCDLDVLDYCATPPPLPLSEEERDMKAAAQCYSPNGHGPDDYCCSVTSSPVGFSHPFKPAARTLFPQSSQQLVGAAAPGRQGEEQAEGQVEWTAAQEDALVNSFMRRDDDSSNSSAAGDGQQQGGAAAALGGTFLVAATAICTPLLATSSAADASTDVAAREEPPRQLQRVAEFPSVSQLLASSSVPCFPPLPDLVPPPALSGGVSGVGTGANGFFGDSPATPPPPAAVVGAAAALGGGGGEELGGEEELSLSQISVDGDLPDSIFPSSVVPAAV